MAASHPPGGPVGSGRGHPDAYTVATTKLSQDWSANRCVPHINEDWLDSLLDDARFASIDPMLKVRLLLAGMVALNQPAHQSSEPARQALQGALSRLQAAAAGDADEWVKVMAAAAGELDGRLDLGAVMQQSAVVQETITGLRQQVQVSNTQQHLLPPLEDVYLRHNPYVLNPDSGHFRLRANPRVQPLSTRVSYSSSATPPPPALAQMARQGEHGATFLRPQAKLLQQRSLPRPAGAAAGDGGGLPLARKGSMAPKAPKIHLLGEAEQQEMQDVLQKSLKAKGHGVAAHVRHEQVPGQKPRMQQQRHHQQQQQQQQHPAGEEEEAAGDAVMMEFMEQQQQGGSEEQEAAVAEAGGPSSRAGRRRRQPPAHSEGNTVASGSTYSAAQRAAAARVEEQLDELFEDSEEDEEWAPAPTGVSRSARGLQHHRGASEEEEAPAELLDDMDDDNDGGDGGDGGAAAGGAMEGVEAEEVRAGLGGGGPGHWESRQGHEQQQQQLDSGALAQAAVAVAAKRRRVIVDDDDDD